jgi:outer membrane protein assembly factor BamE (lipoprotein component of BamABCDE complex)
MAHASEATVNVPCFSRLLPAFAAVLLLIGACANPSRPFAFEAPAGGTSAAPGDSDFPKAEVATRPKGVFPHLEALRAMRTGMDKGQVRELLNSPHFSEGLVGVREWNYIFHFRTGAGAAYVTCQYMVRFDQDMLVNGLFWKNPDCAMLVDAKPIPVTAAPARASIYRVTLGTDRLFSIGGGSLAHMLPGAAPGWKG